ncbi:MAG: hypothetical protein JOZ58_16890 [Acetobacteraceae bacterium]|nr:hypothetical protein [Acetobacteraceae bacterium]MBV8576696.1 hypothetical protein [Acetobacteraceae bacterium]
MVTDEREEERMPVAIHKMDGTTEQHWTTIRKRKPVVITARVEVRKTDGRVRHPWTPEQKE